MGELIVWTYDWAPPPPRGFVRDIRLRWACEEASLAYTVRTVPFEDRGPEHLAAQPFAQIPFLTDGEVQLFESGAGLLHLARKSEKLMPRDAIGEAQTLQWTIAALNSMEMASVPWSIASTAARQATTAVLSPSGLATPRALGTCWRKMMTAIPTVKPSTTGHGT